MNANEFLDFILDKHHEGCLPEDESYESHEYPGRDESVYLPSGCAWIDDIDK